MALKIAVYDPDRMYRERLSEAITSYDPEAFRALPADSPEMISGIDPALVLFGGTEAEADRINGGIPVMLLSESVGYERQGKYARICKYRPVETVIRAIRKETALENGIAETTVRREGSFQLFGVQSPLGRCGRTNLSFALAMALSQTRKTVLIGMRCFSCWAEAMDVKGGFTLSDLLYIENAGMSAESSLTRKNRLDIVLPPEMAEDLLRTDASEIRNAVMRFAEKNGYQAAVLELGSAYAVTEAFQADFRKLFVPTEPGKIPERKVEDYLDWLRRAAPKAADAAETVRVPALIGQRDLPSGFPEGLMLTETGIYARKLIAGE